jgi:hypothetical protein
MPAHLDLNRWTHGQTLRKRTISGIVSFYSASFKTAIISWFHLAQVEHLEELLYEFAGVNSIVTRQQIEEYCNKVNLNPTQIQKSIDLLCESTFLGLETEKDHFEFVFNEEKSDVVRTLARKVRDITGVERYQINIPFRSYLDIKESYL